MQKIMFEHRRFGLEQAVIARLKENTRRRENFPEGIYNYRGCPTTIKPKTAILKDAMEMPDMIRQQTL